MGSWSRLFPHSTDLPEVPGCWAHVKNVSLKQGCISQPCLSCSQSWGTTSEVILPPLHLAGQDVGDPSAWPNSLPLPPLSSARGCLHQLQSRLDSTSPGRFFTMLFVNPAQPADPSPDSSQVFCTVSSHFHPLCLRDHSLIWFLFTRPLPNCFHLHHNPNDFCCT